VIRIEGIHKRFGALEVLRGVDVELAPGRVTAVIGPNGSGKTTLIKMLLGLVKPDRGRISWDGLALNGDSGYRARVGYMPQIVRFPDNLSGGELLDMVTDLRRGQPADTELLDAFGLGPELAKPCRSLSGGTRQKLNAALAFRFDPELLILDEPTAGLDPVASRVLKARVRLERDRGRTILLTSHIMSELEDLADDVVFLLEGRIRYAGSLDDIKVRTGESDLEGAIARLMLEGTTP
jgi:Cu-processing system ATP-binding protein